MAILQSGYTAEHLARALKTEEEKQAVRRNFQELSRFWRQQFAARRINADIINDRQLLTDLYRYNVLVLPLVHCMSDEQIEAVKAFVDANKGVLMTHISGNRDEEGTERHWSLTEDITGGRPIFDLRLREGSTFHQMHSIGLTPITANLAPGAPISIASFDAPLRLRLREGRVFPAAVWLPVDEMHTGRVREDTAIAFGEYLGGRFVWMGFTVNGVGPQRKNWERVDRIIDNAIQWVSHRAVMSTMPWPEGRPVATFAIKAERDIARGASVQRVFAEKGIRPALLLSPDNLSINQMLLQSMRDSVEFGLHLDITKERQKEGFDTAFEQRLQRGRNEFRSILEIDVTSFNLAVRPEPGINHTLDKFLRMGYEFLWIDENDSYAPEIPPIYNQPLFRRLRTPVLFFQSGNPAKLYPDFNPNQEWSTAQRRDLLSTWIRDFEFTRSLNALHTGILPASAVGTDATLPILSEFLQHVRGSGAWLASPSEVAEQWRHHESLRARLIESARMLTIIVSNDSNVALPPFRLRIFPGRMSSSVSVRAERIYVSIPEHVINTSEGYIDLIFSDLGRRENRIYYVELNLPRDR
ncbi:MAG: beta-galactosidase trimerization domain-containing protein [Verrucomicrobia bacterium]|nr:beta-galactosidase trimerization domain-containing protein [Verrucomicrobiota bacterium]